MMISYAKIIETHCLAERGVNWVKNSRNRFSNLQSHFTRYPSSSPSEMSDMDRTDRAADKLSLIKIKSDLEITY